MVVPDAKHLRELEPENNKLKKLPSEACLDRHALNTAFEGARSHRKPSGLPSPP